MKQALLKVKNHIEILGIGAATIHGIGILVGNKDGIYLSEDGEHWKKVEVSHEGFILCN